MKLWMMRLALILALLCPCLAGAEIPQKVVYLTFDDGPKATTPELLELLKELDVPATFFLVGMKIRAFPEEARMLAASGHALGCHTLDHSTGGIQQPEPIQGSMTRISSGFRAAAAIIRGAPSGFL